MLVLRPADAEDDYRMEVGYGNVYTPTALILSRQNTTFRTE